MPREKHAEFCARLNALQVELGVSLHADDNGIFLSDDPTRRGQSFAPADDFRPQWLQETDSYI